MKILYPLLFFCVLSHGEIYKCISDSGQVQFKDAPCATFGKIYTPPPVMTSLKTIKKPNFKSHSQPQKGNTKKTSCPHFTTTELRNLKVKDQFIKGLPSHYIAKRLGKPNSTENSGNNEKWKYKNDFAWREFKFTKGCLVSWKIKWKKDKSQLSKYQ